jgi:ribosome-associated translation inhibitor RaiA
MRGKFGICFRNMAPPFGAEDLARDKATELEQLFGPNIACNLTIEKLHRLNSRGNLFCVEIELIMSGQRFVVHRDPPDDQRHEGLHTAITDAFGEIRRQLRKRGVGSPHETKSSLRLQGTCRVRAG